ncbi:ABC transporter ATP-binding protein [Streptomyces sp. NEAU-W12]|uniref:ABC transporter ATP-binding protein n=1 Tax=Streptomyces sp. NEAU-W12 TaxID=2994668 RepID=UPI00224B2113|nr:ABC transporter ATP-binding protein [Streptomyces sp. NEAU-W12]MCX2925037.1 ABC transporter ATP-binding protein [Streptomyces sp. NEAU-W12]
MTESPSTTAAPGARAGDPQEDVPLLEVRGVAKSFGHGRRRLTAVDGVDLRVGRGRTLGLVGESGCGKSTLARILLGLERPDSGTVRFDGTDPFALRGKELLAWRRRVQMVFQDPFASLNARMSAADLIGEPWRTHRDVVPGAKAREKRIRELLAMVGLRDSDAHRFPGEFSGGQRQRIGIARALALDPDLIVCDEPVSALDLSVQAQVLNVLSELRARLGVTYVFISHDLSVVRHVSDQVTVMYLGKVVEHGDTDDVFDRPQHPYTAALMSAAPVLDTSRAPGRPEIQLRGEVPSPFDIPSGCRFRTRCRHAEDVCATQVPPLVRRETDSTADGGADRHTALCHFPLEAESSWA